MVDAIGTLGNMGSVVLRQVVASVVLLAATATPTRAAPTSQQVAPTCRIVDEAQLIGLLKKSGRDEVLFFASWCASCRDHVRRAPRRALLVGAFDDAAPIAAVLRFLNYRGPCLLATHLATRLDIRAVPAHFRLSGDTLLRLPRPARE